MTTGLHLDGIGAPALMYARAGGHMRASRVLLMIAAAAGAIGTFLPWVELGVFQVPGTVGDGWITLGLFAVALVMALLGRTEDEIPAAARVAAGLCAIGAGAIAVHLIVLTRAGPGIVVLGDVAQLNVGAGVYLIGIAAAAIVLISVAGRPPVVGAIVVVAATAAVALMAWYADSLKSQSRAHERSADVAMSSAAATVFVSSDELQSVYSENELRGDQLYKGKVLEVTGAVQQIGNGVDDEPFVKLWTRDEFAGVRAHFQNGVGLSSLARGQHITIRCAGDGMVTTSPSLRDCVLLAVQ